MVAVPAVAGLIETMAAAVNGPPATPSVSSTVAAAPATRVTLREGATIVGKPTSSVTVVVALPGVPAAASVTITSKLKARCTVGVPLITPFSLNVNPVGSCWPCASTKR